MRQKKKYVGHTIIVKVHQEVRSGQVRHIQMTDDYTLVSPSVFLKLHMSDASFAGFWCLKYFGKLGLFVGCIPIRNTDGFHVFRRNSLSIDIEAFWSRKIHC